MRFVGGLQSQTAGYSDLDVPSLRTKATSEQLHAEGSLQPVISECCQETLWLKRPWQVSPLPPFAWKPVRGRARGLEIFEVWRWARSRRFQVRCLAFPDHVRSQRLHERPNVGDEGNASFVIELLPRDDPLLPKSPESSVRMSLRTGSFGWMPNSEHDCAAELIWCISWLVVGSSSCRLLSSPGVHHHHCCHNHNRSLVLIACMSCCLRLFSFPPPIPVSSSCL